jgi:alkyldihydroxyacetonephosphate synthase
VLLRAGLAPAGRRPGAAWAASRFAGPHLRDHLLDRGVLTETLETATTWSRVHELRDDVVSALRTALDAPLVGCHVSHVYATGASLYVTVLARREDDGAAQWRRAKDAATDVILASGATVTHHHAVGRDHAQWLRREDGAQGVEALRAVKRALDPGGVMNPGVLLAQQDDL